MRERSPRSLVGFKGARPAAWITALGVAGLALALLAGLEADRARRTADVLLQDYAAFVADKFLDASAQRHGYALGLPGFEAKRGRVTALGRLREFAERDTDRAPLLEPPAAEVAYVFRYDVERDELVFSGAQPDAPERERLRAALRGYDPACGPTQLYTFAHLARTGEALVAPDWAGVARTDAQGRVLRVWGLKVDERRAAESFVVPLLAAEHECDCLRKLLPPGLSSVADPRKVAGFVLRDRDGQERFRSPGATPSEHDAQRALTAAPTFAGWTVTVTVDAAAVRPLLPYGGRGTPGLLVMALGLATLVAAALALRSARRDAELLRLRQDFVANVSHELKTPVARIRLFNELLASGKQADPSRRRHYEEVIGRECRRLAFLVDNVLDFARFERGARPSEKQRLDLAQLAHETLESFKSACEDGRVSLRARLEPVFVLGSAAALEQALMNLLDNAVKYSPQGGGVELELCREGTWARLSVHDQGCGIPSEHHARIFEDFYRVESGEAQRVSGSGLGLALVRRSVEAHGGRVAVDSRPGAGSTFTVWLPLAGEAEPQPGSAPAAGESVA